MKSILNHLTAVANICKETNESYQSIADHMKRIFSNMSTQIDINHVCTTVSEWSDICGDPVSYASVENELANLTNEEWSEIMNTISANEALADNENRFFGVGAYHENARVLRGENFKND